MRTSGRILPVQGDVDRPGVKRPAFGAVGSPGRSALSRMTPDIVVGDTVVSSSCLILVIVGVERMNRVMSVQVGADTGKAAPEKSASSLIVKATIRRTRASRRCHGRAC